MTYSNQGNEIIRPQGTVISAGFEEYNASAVVSTWLVTSNSPTEEPKQAKLLQNNASDCDWWSYIVA